MLLPVAVVHLLCIHVCIHGYLGHTYKRRRLLQLFQYVFESQAFKGFNLAFSKC